MTPKAWSFIKPYGNYMPEYTKGWGCGYVVIPKGHIAYNYVFAFASSNSYPDYRVHGGITYCLLVNESNKKEKETQFHREFELDDIIIGFDTMHVGDVKHMHDGVS